MYLSLSMLFVGCMTRKPAQSPLNQMLGEWEQQGMLLADEQLQPVYSYSTCERLTSPNDIVCTGQTADQDSWMELYEWDPDTERITYQSLRTLSEQELCRGEGTWNTESNVLSMDCVKQNSNGELQGVKIERSISTTGSSLEEYELTNGRRIQTFTLQSLPHSSTELDYKLPYALLDGSYKSWLQLNIDPQEGLLTGCRTEKQGGECERKTLELSSEDLQAYYVHKMHVTNLKECPSVVPHAHDIMAEVRLKGQIYRNTFYYNPNGMEHHHADDACPQVSEFAEWVYQIWDERLSE